MSYKLGIFEFDTEEEYKDAKDDYARIKEIKEKCDLDDPATVKKLLFLIKNKKIVFKTKVGAAFVKVLIKKFEEQNGVSFGIPEKAVSATEKSDDENEKYVEEYEEDGNDDEIFEVPAIIVKAGGFRNFLSIVFFIASFVVPYFVFRFLPFLDVFQKMEKKYIFNDQFYDIETSDYRYSSLMLAILAGITIINALRIGISNLKKMNRRKKKADEIIKSHLTADELKEIEEAEREEEKYEGIRIIAGIIMFILAIVCFPLFLGILVILLIFAQIDRLKYLWKNRRAFLLGILTVFGYLADYAFCYGTYNLREIDNDVSVSKAVFIHILRGPICLSIAIGIPVILLFLMKALLKTQTYLSIRNMASYPIELALFLLPFAAVALLAYARYNPNSGNNKGNPYGGPGGSGGNPNGGIGPQFVYVGEPPTVDVKGHPRHYANGKTVWIKKHSRTMPDATILNNFSYRGN